MANKCLHCILCAAIEDYIQENNIDDTAVAFVALADVMGDLFVDDAVMFRGKKHIAERVVARAIDRAEYLSSQDSAKAEHQTVQ